MNSTDFAYCRKCYYLSRCGSDITCDYIGKTGHMRGCPAGVGCTKRLIKKKRRQILPVLFPRENTSK